MLFGCYSSDIELLLLSEYSILFDEPALMNERSFIIIGSSANNTLNKGIIQLINQGTGHNITFQHIPLMLDIDIFKIPSCSIDNSYKTPITTHITAH